MAAATAPSDLSYVGHYRSKDPIENFKIRVTLQKVKGSSLVPPQYFGGESDNGFEMQTLQIKDQDPDFHQCDFLWQEKKFSQKEINFYSKRSNCKNYLHEKYHQKVLEISSGEQPHNRLFSYTSAESLQDRCKLKPITTSAKEGNFLAQQIQDLHMRSNFPRPSNQRIKDVLPNMNIVDEKPSKETKLNTRSLNMLGQSMFIMADLKPQQSKEDAHNEEDELILCKIIVGTNNVISVSPDFTRDLKQPYLIEYRRNGIRDTYHYTIKHISNNISETGRVQEEKLYKELCIQHSEFLASCVSSTFDMPQLGILKIFLNGEIVSAKNFEYDNLYVHFFVKLSEGWTASNDSSLFHVTQVCRTKCDKKSEVAYFCYPFNIELDYKIGNLDENNSEYFPKWPMLYLEVLSLDTWGRFRTEGYGHIILPSNPGIFCKDILTWRPLLQSTVGELRRFFIGGSPRLEDLSSAGVPSNFEECRLSKLGFKTATSGSVKIKMNIIHQSQAFLSSETHRKKMGSIIDRLGAVTVQSGVAAVLVAFQRARQRMLAARKQVLTS